MAEIAQSIVRARAETPVAPFVSVREGDGSRDRARQLAAGAFVDELYASVLEPQRLAFALTNFARAFDAAEAWLVAHDDLEDLRVLERSLTDSTRRVGEPGLARLLTETISGWPSARAAGIRSGLLRDVAGNYLAVTTDVPGQAAVSLVAFRTFPFSESEREAADALTADIRRAVQLRGRVGSAGAVGDGLRMFENTSVALFVTRERRVERSNAAAAALVAAGPPVVVSGGKLRFEDSRAQSAFEAISRPDAQANTRQNFAFVVEGVAGRTWIAQMSLARQPNPPTAQGSSVIVALTPFSGASETREAMLDGFTELTPTERAIFAAVVDGQDVAAIAARMNRSIETVRWHVRNLFTKLGVNSQADLARLGALLLPI